MTLFGIAHLVFVMSIILNENDGGLQKSKCRVRIKNSECFGNILMKKHLYHKIDFRKLPRKIICLQGVTVITFKVFKFIISDQISNKND